MNENSERPAQADGSGAEAFPALDLSSPQLTLRAIVTGMLIGGVLSFGNIYSGLKIGWGFNVSVIAALLAYGFWQSSHRMVGSPSMGLLENNISLTAANSAAAISASGLISAIPALTIVTGQSLSWPWLALWMFVISSAGVVVAIGLRRQFLFVDRLPFAAGIVTAETLKEMYARGSEALARIKALLSAGLVGAALNLAVQFWKWSPVGIPGALTPSADSKLRAAGIHKVTLTNLGFALDPSLLMVGVGALIDVRVSWSMLFGAIVAWGVIGPHVLDLGWAKPGDAAAPWFGPMDEWMMWPGVTMMVTASLASFAFTLPSMFRALGRRASKDVGFVDPGATQDVSRRAFLILLAAALVITTILQSWMFPIALGAAFVAVLLAFALAIVAGRVSGETAITPVGPVGKVTQLLFGVVSPGNATANLMAANVTAGAASQCADLLDDLKTGVMIGASPRQQSHAQFWGVLAGALMGSAAYLVLIPDPKRMLLTEKWPAPAVAAWKAVAEVLARGIDTMPAGAVDAMLWAGAIGVLLAMAEKFLPPRVVRFVPSPSAAGLAFVIPAWYSISTFLGAIAALVASRVAKSWTERFLIVLAAGVIVGESLAGVGVALQDALSQLGR
jgi:putative OPT family oligopeptide transporter